MKIIKDHSHLKVILDQDLNLFIAKRIWRLAQDHENVVIDLTNTRLVDSEGIILLYNLIQEGIRVELIDPPEILFRIADLLELKTLFDFRNLVSSPPVE